MRRGSTIKRWLFVPTILICLFILSVSVGGAQPETPVPIDVGEVKVGEITTAGAVLTYAIPISTPQTIDVDVFAITSGFVPAFRVLNQTGSVIQEMNNATNQSVIRATSIPVSPGLYLVEVRGGSDMEGQFLISIQASVPLQPPQRIATGQVFDGQVNNALLRQAYEFTGDATTPLLLTIYGAESDSMLEIVLKNALTAEMLATSTTAITGVRYRIAPGLMEYQVEVIARDVVAPQDYIICLEYAGGPRICPVDLDAGAQTSGVTTATAVPLVPSLTPTIQTPLPATGPCVIASGAGGPVNIRSGPSTSNSVIGQISGNTTALVIGRLSDNTWYQINLSGIIGWISASVVRVGGVCSVVPSVTLTPAPTDIIATPSPSASETPTATMTITATPLTPTAVATLNFSLPPVYGSTTLTSGFVPDPFSVGITSGGPANVAYLGGGCSGYATSAPSFSVNYTAGAFPLLRFYFIGNGDTTMIVNTPGGSYICVDDSFGTLNPTIDFNSPASGRYDIWIASFAEGGAFTGTLYVTENSGNHP